MERLDNPVWCALQGRHAHFAQGDATVAGYPADVAPFAAVSHHRDHPSEDGLGLALAGSSFAYFIDIFPTFPARVQVEACPPILQMVCERLPAESDPLPPAIRDLGDTDVEAMLDLTGRVFPGYFRRRTIAMGRYVGVFDGERLVAMGGERLFADRCREVSGICTDPKYVGRGYAGAIVRDLASSMLDQGLLPILHLSPANVRAHRLYQSLGFADCGELDVIKVTA